MNFPILRCVKYELVLVHAILTDMYEWKIV